MVTDAMRAAFIFWSYAGCALLIAAIIGWIVFDAWRVKRRLADLDKAGIRRRSAGTGS